MSLYKKGIIYEQLVPTRTVFNTYTDTRDSLMFQFMFWTAYSGGTPYTALSQWNAQLGLYDVIYTVPVECYKFEIKHNGVSRDVNLVTLYQLFEAGHVYYISARVTKKDPRVYAGFEATNMMLIDLTKTYGAGLEPTTKEEVRAAFTLPWYGYNQLD